jgi:MoaA/NifB/PqqE/SkfB family radical SAM enzyme
MCDIWKANRNGVEITAEQFAPHVEAVRRLNVQWVTLSGGEALMHSNLWQLCRQLKQVDVRIILLSTGLLLRRHAADVVRWCDEVIVSLDGSAAVHDAIRNVPRAFDRLHEGLSAIRELVPDLRMTGRCVLQRQNFRDLPNTIEAAHDLQLDQISFLAADVSTAAFNRPQLWGNERVAEVALSPDEVAEFRRIVTATIKDYADDFATGYIAESPAKIWRLVQYYDALNGHDEFPPVACNAPWVSTVIEPDGRVRPCFFHEPYGNIHEQPLAEILNSPTAVAFRRDLVVSENPICRKCVCSLNLSPRAPLTI